MNKIKSGHFLVLALLFAVTCGGLGYIIGQRGGYKEGIETGAIYARTNLEFKKDFILSLERSMAVGDPTEKEIRNLMVTVLEGYLPERTLLAQPPFNQEYLLFEKDSEAIEVAINRLGSKTANLTYE